MMQVIRPSSDWTRGYGKKQKDQISPGFPSHIGTYISHCTRRRFRHSFHHRNEDSMAVRMDYNRCNCVVHLDVHDVDVDEEKIT